MSIFEDYWQKHPLSLKWALALCLAMSVVFALSQVMGHLIQPGRVTLKEPMQSARLEFVRIRRDETVEEKRRTLPEKPPDVPKPPAQPQQQIHQPAPQATMDMALPDLNLPVQLDRGTSLSSLFQGSGSGLSSLFQGSGDGDVVPLVRVEPIYPQLALNRGLEGWVKVGLQISPQGTVKDAEVLEAEPPHVFNRAVMRAVMRWKFKPKIANGVPVENYVTQVIKFTMEK